MTLVDDRLDGVLERARGGQRDHRDARDHDLVDALVAELDDRVDHLLLLGLEDALLAALLDVSRSSSELMRSSAATSAPNRRLMCRVVQVRKPTSGPNNVPRIFSSRLVAIATRSAWARPICLGTSSRRR